MYWFRQVLIGLTLLSLGSGNALADRRVALVIGNSAYQNVAKLSNPVRDANAIAGLFTSAGFDLVRVHRDLGIGELRRAIREFSRQTLDADIAVVFYAGHGIEFNGNNYLIPVDARLEQDLDVEDETVSLDRVLAVVDPAKRLRLVILDACRDNPFLRTMKRSMASRAIGRGLAQVEPGTSDTLIAFAARAGSIAVDGEGPNSPFTAALLKHIAEPGLDLRIAFGRVRDDVFRSTGRTQEPFLYGSLGGSTVSLVPAPVKVELPLPPPPITSPLDERRDYEFAAHASTQKAWDAFLARYKTGFYADLAREERAKLIDPGQAKIELPKLEPPKEAGPATAAVAAKPAPRTEHTNTIESTTAATKSTPAEQVASVPLPQEIPIEKPPSPAAVPATPDVKNNAGLILAAIPPAAEIAKERPNQPTSFHEIARLLQVQLKRVGCDPGADNGEWSAGSRRALEAFNKHAGTKLDVRVASLDALDVVRSKNSRVCPLVCSRGHRIAGDRCVAIACKAGYVLDEDGNCERRSEPAKTHAVPEKRQTPRETDKPVAAREEPKSPTRAEHGRVNRGSPGSAEGHKILCNDKGGCRPVPANCREGNLVGGLKQIVCPQ